METSVKSENTVIQNESEVISKTCEAANNAKKEISTQKVNENNSDIIKDSKTYNKKRKPDLKDVVLDPNRERPYFVCCEGCPLSYGFDDTTCFDCGRQRVMILAKCNDCSDVNYYGTECYCNGRTTYRIKVIENIEVKEYVGDLTY